MRTRRLGATDLEITVLGLGAWAIGGSGWEYGWGPQDDRRSIEAIARALDAGVNWIDTAAVYGLGHSEEVVARALAGRASKPLVFTKCGLVADPTGHVSRVLCADSIRRECEASLRRLQTDVIDLYQIHWPNEDIEEAWSTMAALQREGKVRHVGVSNFDVAQMRVCQRIAPIASLQPPYSLLRRDVERDVLPFCDEQDIGVIVYSPMYSGLLSGAMTPERASTLPADDWRARDPEFRSPQLEKNLVLVEVLRAIGARHGGKTPGEVAVAWALRRPEVTGAIVGARSALQVEGWIGAAELALTPDDLDEIERAL